MQYLPYPYNPNMVMSYNNLPIEFYYFKGNSIGFWPLFTGNYVIDYYCVSQQMVLDTDLPILPLNNFGYMMVNYAVKRAYLKSGRADLVRVQELEKQEQLEDAQFTSYLQTRQVQYNQSMVVTDSGFMGAASMDMEDSFEF